MQQLLQFRMALFFGWQTGEPVCQAMSFYIACQELICEMEWTASRSNPHFPQSVFLSFLEHAATEGQNYEQKY
ncbi:MAG: hypothetical protein R2792_14200 [Saprospiraceae bacterium]